MSDNPHQPDRYGILGLDKSCSTDDIRARRRQLSKRFHPSGSEPDEAKIREINAACDFLEDPEERKQYDHKRAVDAAVKEHKAKVDEAKRERERGPRDTKAFGDRVRNQAGSTAEEPPPGNAPPPPQRPAPPRPTPSFQPPPPPRPPARPLAASGNPVPSPGSEAGVVLALDELPPIDWSGARAIGARLIALVAALALLGSPFVVMSATGAASNDHLSGGWAIELGCFALFVLGLVAVACVLGAIFSRD